MTDFEKCIAFHGHVCPGLAIGYRAAEYATRLLNLDYSEDEQVVCISENDACGVDAIQVMLGCSVGKGNLLFHMTGKQAFNIYKRSDNSSLRLVLKSDNIERTRQESLEHYLNSPLEELFDIKDTVIPLPERAVIYESFTCECCGERTGANWLRVKDGQKLCIDCFEKS